MKITIKTKDTDISMPVPLAMADSSTAKHSSSRVSSVKGWVIENSFSHTLE